jgi:hypothetical protein
MLISGSTHKLGLVDGCSVDRSTRYCDLEIGPIVVSKRGGHPFESYYGLSCREPWEGELVSLAIEILVGGIDRVHIKVVYVARSMIRDDDVAQLVSATFVESGRQSRSS